MKAFLKYSLCLAVLMGAWQAAWAQDDIAEEVDSVFTQEALTGEGFNPWSDSDPFLQGVKELDLSLDYDKAASCFSQELKLHPSNGYAMCNLAMSKSHQAEVTLNKSTYDILNIPGIDRDAAQELYLTARIQYFASLNEAIDLMKDGIALLPSDDEESQCRATVRLAEFLTAAEADVDDVIKTYKKAIDLHPCDGCITPFLAYAKQQDRKADALEVISNLKELPSDIDVKWLLAINAYNNGDYHRALELTREELAAEHDVNNASFAAEVYYMLGDVDKALVMLDEAQRLNAASKETGPDYYINRRIAIEMNCGMVDEVIHDAKVSEIVCSGNPEALPNAYSALGWAYSAKRQWSEAIAAYDKWAQLNPNDYGPAYWAARAKVLAGNTAQGRKELEELLNIVDFSGNQELKMNMLYYLGRTSESRAILDALAQNSELVMWMNKQGEEMKGELPEVMSLYNLACAYSLHGESSTALDYLKRCFESAEAEPNFDYAVLDYDFDNIRKNPKFMELINTYKTKWLNGTLKKVGSIN